MNKTDKKKIESEVVDAINKLLATYHKSAAAEVTKPIKSAGKIISKKFSKIVKQLDKKASNAKKNGAAAKPSTKSAVKPATKKRRKKSKA